MKAALRGSVLWRGFLVEYGISLSARHCFATLVASATRSISIRPATQRAATHFDCSLDMDHTHEDLQMHREMWAGHVPIQLELHRNEVASTQTPDTLFILAPRMGYLPIATQEAEQYFKAFAPPAVDGTDGFWLEDNGTPLKWYAQAAPSSATASSSSLTPSLARSLVSMRSCRQFPTGVLYDLHARRSQFEGMFEQIRLRALARERELNDPTAPQASPARAPSPRTARGPWAICHGRSRRTFEPSLPRS